MNLRISEPRLRSISKGGGVFLSHCPSASLLAACLSSDVTAQWCRMAVMTWLRDSRRSTIGTKVRDRNHFRGSVLMKFLLGNEHTITIAKPGSSSLHLSEMQLCDALRGCFPECRQVRKRQRLIVG